MPSPADRFTRLEKIAVFLITLGEERTRLILSDVDLDTVEQLNEAVLNLGEISAEEKAAVMLEFARFFYQDEPIDSGSAALTMPTHTLSGTTAKPPPPKETEEVPGVDEPAPPVEHNLSSPVESSDEIALLRTLEKLRQRLDPGNIDWGKAGYDFGEGFKGPEGTR